MKKFVIALIALIAVLAVVLFLKINGGTSVNSSTPISETPPSSFTNTSNSSDFSNPSSSSGYSSEDIEKLILKGKETILKADNVYYETHSSVFLNKYYYKGSKLKREGYGLSSPTISIENAERLTTDIVNFDKNITDRFNHVDKFKHTANYTIGSKSLFQEKLINLIESTLYITELIYVKDDILDGKDCIVIKAFRYDAKTHELETWFDRINAYWIEKSTGFYVGNTYVMPNENPTGATSTLKNLSFGTVKDSDLAEPQL